MKERQDKEKRIRIGNIEEGGQGIRGGGPRRGRILGVNLLLNQTGELSSISGYVNAYKGISVQGRYRGIWLAIELPWTDFFFWPIQPTLGRGDRFGTLRCLVAFCTIQPYFRSFRRINRSSYSYPKVTVLHCGFSKITRNIFLNKNKYNLVKIHFVVPKMFLTVNSFIFFTIQNFTIIQVKHSWCRRLRSNT